MHHTKWMCWTTAGQLLIAGLAIAGCATTPAAPAASASAPAAEPASGGDAATAEQAEAAEQLRSHHRHHHHGGVAAFIALSIDSLNVSPEKKDQLEKIRTDLEAKMAPARDAERAMLTTIADGVVAGSIDKAKVDEKLAQAEAAAANVHIASQDSLNQLHALLSPEERQALVDKVQAHWAVWRQVSHEEKLASHEKGTHLAKLTVELNLTGDQVSQIEQALSSEPPPSQADTDAVQAHIDAFTKAFASDTFDAASLSTANAANAHIAKFGMARTAHFYEAVNPVLTPEQRTKLAAQLQKHLSSAQPS